MGRKSARSLGIVLLVAVLVSLLLSSAAPTTVPSRSAPVAAAPVRTSAASGQYFDYFAIILMENHNLCDIYYGNASQSPCGTTPTGGAYETNLADTYGIPLNYRYCNVNPSLPNYLCLTGGSDFGCSGYDGGPNSNNCTAAAWSSQNIVDRLESGGVSWKAYMEDMPSNCDPNGAGNYAVRHDPFVYYNDIRSNTNRCNLVVPAGPSAGSYSAFLNDLNSTSTASNYMWLTPNTCHDMHDCTIAQGDAYLAGLVPQILNSPVFTTQRAALFVVFDEGYGLPTYAAWAGPVVKRGHSSTATYTHFSLLSTLEANWNLPPVNTTNDGTAPSMSEFFTTAIPDFHLTASPSAVLFPPGQSGTSTVGVQAVNGFTGPVTLSVASTPAGLTSSCAPSSVSPGGSSTCTFNSTTIGNYTATVTGTNGTITHTVDIAVTVSNSIPPSTTMQLQGTLGAHGWYVTSVVITLTSTPSGGSIVIHDNLDNASWQVYSSPFTVTDGPHWVQYYATNGTGVTEPTHAASVRVDTAPPSVTSQLVGTRGANGWYTSGVRITLVGTDATSGIASMSYTIDSGAAQSYSAPFDVTDGVHQVVYSATDVAGLQSASGNLSLKVNTSPPVFGSLSPSGQVDQSTVTVSWSATDAAGITGYSLRVDNSSYENVGTNTSISLNLADGPHTVQVIATDGAGLHNAAVIQFRVSTGTGGGTGTGAGGDLSGLWLILLPLVAAGAILAAAGVAVAVSRRRRRRRKAAEMRRR